LLERNKVFAARQSDLDALASTGAPKLKSNHHWLRGYAYDPANLLGLEPGKTVVMRNIGGRVTPGLLEELGCWDGWVRLRRSWIKGYFCRELSVRYLKVLGQRGGVAHQTGDAPISMLKDDEVELSSPAEDRARTECWASAPSTG
jgi:hypothetical protein